MSGEVQGEAGGGERIKKRKKYKKEEKKRRREGREGKGKGGEKKGRENNVRFPRLSDRAWQREQTYPNLTL